jgi:hypothetical protein
VKITVPGFVTEENVQEALKRFAMKGVSPDATVLTAVATTIGLLEKLGPDAADAANAAGTLPDIAAGELEEIKLSTLLPSLPQEELKFIEDDAVSRGMKLKFTSNHVKLVSNAAELIRLHPKKEISVTLPEETR